MQLLCIKICMAHVCHLTPSSGNHLLSPHFPSGAPKVPVETHVELRPRQRQRLSLRRRLRDLFEAPGVAAGIEEKASAVLAKDHGLVVVGG